MVDKILKLIKSLVFRIHILKIVSIVLFLVICFRLYSIQVTYSPDYTNYIERSTTVELQKNVPRGVIYDRNFDVLVDNEAVNTITYQLYSDVSKSQMKDIASQLANLIEVDFSKLTSRDLKDLYLEVFKEEANELVTAKEIKELDDNEIYQLQLSRITDEMLEKLSDHDKETQAIYINMNKGTNLTSNIIKKGATQDEIAIVSEHLESLPGVNTDVDWDRTYPSVAGISPIYGRVSSYEQGLPANLSGYYKAHDYQSNDRVGLSQLELYYEALLRGSKSQYVLKNENEVSNYQEIYEGQRGYELVLSLDAELQAALNKIVEDELIAAKTNRPVATQYLREAYVVMLNPNTGEVLSMTGKVIEYNEETKQYEIYDNSLGTIQNAFTMGSVVKGASLLAGYHYGVTDINQYITDGPLSFKGGLIKKSWKTLGYINDSDALKFSSNVYFMLQTIRLGGGTYVPGGPLVLDVSAFDQYREFFNQFGLGVSTGIDLPNESIGLIETNKTSGKLLDFSIGQADIYTTMQLAQYVSTIATSG
ncbi:MAG: penicillin-binding transpeptidase domain-containing protein, partial [Turicibacter sanguinis]